MVGDARQHSGMAIPRDDLETVAEHRSHQVGAKHFRWASLASHAPVGEHDDA